MWIFINRYKTRINFKSVFKIFTAIILIIIWTIVILSFKNDIGTLITREPYILTYKDFSLITMFWSFFIYGLYSAIANMLNRLGK